MIRWRRRIIMIKKIAILFSFLSLVSCAGFQSLPADYNFGEPPKNVDSAVKNYFYTVLKDPDSARYQIGSPFKAYQNEGLAYGGGIGWTGYAVDVRINAKNSYGGYTGWTPYLVYFRGERISYHCKKRENLNESVFDVCNDTLFSRVNWKNKTVIASK